MAMPPHLAAAAGAGAPGVDGSASLGPVVILAVTIVALLALFALGAVLLAGFRRRRLQSGSGGRPPGPQTDAWAEAGRRMETPDEGFGE